MKPIFSTPMPCSPVTLPPSSRHFFEDLVAGLEHPAESAPGSRSSNSRIGWMLPSPAWNTLTNAHAVLLAVAVMLQDLRQLGARHDAVLRAVTGAEPADRAEGLLAALPQQLPLRRRRRLADFPGAAAWQSSTIGLASFVDGDLQAVDFDQQHRPASSGKPK
jgi:hypothetical protein